MTNPINDSNMPWWALVVIIVVVLIVFVLIPWKRIFKKKDDKEITDNKKLISENIKEDNKKNKPMWGLYNNFGKKEALRARTYIYVEEKEDSCSLCRQFENKILAVDKYAKNTLTMREAISRGYHHIGCTHNDLDYFHEVTKIPESKWSNDHKEKLHQIKLKQFRFEDDIRKIKYEIEESLDKAEAQKLELSLKELSSKYELFLKKNNLKRRLDKEEPNIEDYKKFI